MLGEGLTRLGSPGQRQTFQGGRVVQKKNVEEMLEKCWRNVKNVKEVEL